MKTLVHFIFLFILTSFVFAQKRVDSLFQKHPDLKGIYFSNKQQAFGTYSNYDLQKNKTPQFFKSLGENKTDIIDFKVNLKKVKWIDSIYFLNKLDTIKSRQTSHNTIQLRLPKKDTNYTVTAYYKHQAIASLQVIVLKEKKQTITLVPLQTSTYNLDSITLLLNQKFRAANIVFTVQLTPSYHFKDSLFKNPASGRLKYTEQMIELRDYYLKQHASSIQNSIVFFLIPGFEDSLIKSFTVKEKALGFLSNKLSTSSLSQAIIHEYIYGYVNSSYQLDSTVNRRLTNEQWLEINENPAIYSYIDDYEDVVTNNGLIAYYLWKENKDGSIAIVNNDFLSSIQRPLKKNTYSYHLQITSPFYKSLFQIKGKSFTITHLLSCVVSIFLVIFVFRRFRSYLKRKNRYYFFIQIPSYFIEWCVIGLTAWGTILLVDKGYYWFEVSDGVITSFSKQDNDQIIDELKLNVHPKKLEEKQIGSEIILQKGTEYLLKKQKRVLKFRMQLDTNNQVKKIKFIGSSNQLNTKLLPQTVNAESHYIHLQITDTKGKWLREEIYNHLGVNLTEKINLEDPPKRILLFVNGYRPTSLGRSFSENFDNIQKYGMEFPNSLNRIFTYDRYNYWNPWGKIDELFKDRINPTETYYADGHHSVATSNHRSVLKFASNSQQYPKRCENENHHTCQMTHTRYLGLFGSRSINTYHLLATKPNRSGFKKREQGGRIAGRNLYQLMNELPNSSKNDTLYIIAHSMGFAYAQGIVNQLKGLIQFGGYYIIAAENAGAGYVKVTDWQEVWQYGSNLGQKHEDEPCLQDGVAPQTAVKGLNADHRIFIAPKLYKKKGYFDSHFIGYYNWITDIPENQRGNIKKH